MQAIGADLRFAARLLRKSPAFTVTAVVSLALGLAASTAIFSLADALLLRPRPGIADPDRLVDLGRTEHPGGFDTLSYPHYADYRDRTNVFSGMAAYRVDPMPLSLDARGGVDRVFGLMVSGNYFSVLGVRPSRGRVFGPAEDGVEGPHPVAVISARRWHQRFDADPGVVGTYVAGMLLARTAVADRDPAALRAGRSRRPGPDSVAPPPARGAPAGAAGPGRHRPATGPRGPRLRVPAVARRRVRAVPGVEQAAVAGVVPMGGDGLSFGNVRVPGRVDPGAPDGFEADWNLVTADFFRTLQIPIVSGRSFLAAEQSGEAGVAIVNQAMARTLWPGRNPVGQSFEVVGPRGVDRTLRVVGVARDAKYRWLGDSARLFVYVPFGQESYDRQALLVKRRSPGSAVPAVRQILRTLSPGMPIIQTTTMEDYAAVGLLPQRLAAGMAGWLGLVGLLLAGLGIHGVTAYNATQRTRELAVRMALGSSRSGLIGLVLWYGFRLAVAGAGLGLAVTLAASWFPARRAAAADTVQALRAE